MSRVELVPLSSDLFEDYDGHSGREEHPNLSHLTCVNHPTARYLTKNPYQRNLHLVQPCEEAPQMGWPCAGYECPCPFSDLRAVLVYEA